MQLSLSNRVCMATQNVTHGYKKLINKSIRNLAIADKDARKNWALQIFDC
jgi:hypothetical protein